MDVGYIVVYIWRTKNFVVFIHAFFLACDLACLKLPWQVRCKITEPR